MFRDKNNQTVTIFFSDLHADSVLHINYKYKLVYIPMLFAIIKTRFRKLEEKNVN